MFTVNLLVPTPSALKRTILMIFIHDVHILCLVLDLVGQNIYKTRKLSTHYKNPIICVLSIKKKQMVLAQSFIMCIGIYRRPPAPLWYSHYFLLGLKVNTIFVLNTHFIMANDCALIHKMGF
jgi:hypothetical protein